MVDRMEEGGGVEGKVRREEMGESGLFLVWQMWSGVRGEMVEVASGLDIV